MEFSKQVCFTDSIYCAVLCCAVLVCLTLGALRPVLRYFWNVVFFSPLWFLVRMPIASSTNLLKLSTGNRPSRNCWQLWSHQLLPPRSVVYPHDQPSTWPYYSNPKLMTYWLTASLIHNMVKDWLIASKYNLLSTASYCMECLFQFFVCM